MCDVDFVQFARLLDEINVLGLTEDQFKTLAKSMEIEPKDVKQLLNRASAKCDDLKPLLMKKAPLTENQVAEELAENGKIEVLVAMDFNEIIGHLEDEALESVVDEISERTAAVPLSNVDYKVLFADKDALYLRVTAQADDLEDDDDEEEIDETVEV